MVVFVVVVVVGVMGSFVGAMEDSSFMFNVGCLGFLKER